MLSFNLPALFVSLVITLVMAILGGLRTSNPLTQWFPTLQKPRFQLPLWAFISVGIVVYLLDTIIAYRLRAAGDEPDRSPHLIDSFGDCHALQWTVEHRLVSLLEFAGFLGVLAFLAPLLLLQVILLLVEPISGLLMLIYVLWVVLYDIPWSYALWKLNLPEHEKVDGSTSSWKFAADYFSTSQSGKLASSLEATREEYQTSPLGKVPGNFILPHIWKRLRV
jgi:tryptophan-rich sensory protein